MSVIPVRIPGSAFLASYSCRGAALGAAIEPLENPSMTRAVIGLDLLILPAKSRFLHSKTYNPKTIESNQNVS